MASSQALEKFKNELHISHNQIFNYLSCSLKYFFQYVESRPYECVSVSLPFGGAVHSALELLYRKVKDTGRVPALDDILTRFEDALTLDIGTYEVPLIYKKDTPDLESLLAQGRAMLTAYHENLDLTGFEVVDVELPLAARLYTEDGRPTDIQLIGFIDLLLMDEARELVCVDHKTAARAKDQKTVDEDLQFSAYAYLLSANRFTPQATSPVVCRMDVIRKLKTPKVEQYITTRTAFDRKRFTRIANAVLAGIDNRIFIPTRSWLCADCPYADACSRW